MRLVSGIFAVLAAAAVIACSAEEPEQWADGPGCHDGVQSLAEADVDCGGPCLVVCGMGKGCRDGRDCASTECQHGICVDHLECGGPADFCGTGKTVCGSVLVNDLCGRPQMFECGGCAFPRPCLRENGRNVCGNEVADAG